MNKIKTNQVWQVPEGRIIIGEVFPVSAKVFSALSGKLEIWLHSEILLYGELVA